MIGEGLRRVPRPLFVSMLLLLHTRVAPAQDPVRPWLDWRTMSTSSYRFHYPREFEGWTRYVAERVESVDSAIASLVGYAAPKPVHVVVDDPFVIPNGYAIPFLDKPVTVWWATPADPRSDIGNYTTWGELLAIHELTHLAHLARPSRDRFKRAIWSSMPANVGPITLNAPRWVYEGYATMIEGRISGTGRPNNVWRPALLRQWAIEGRLPTYGQLSAWNDFNGGEFAYLGGSAFLEWLARREGDSSLVHVWRRMTARQERSFEASFGGVYGDAPSRLYGLHTAELTRDAMAAKAELERAGIVEGQLIQRLSWATGDPAISPNGARVAVTLRERDRPGRLVVWDTAAQPEDTAAVRKRISAQKRDPADVPDRRFYPVTKKAEKTLTALNGRSFQLPRWYADNKRLLVTRWTTRADASLSPALYEWNTESGVVRKVTSAVGVLHGDPHPNSTEAVAMQCHWGHCDIVHVDLARGVMRTLLEGTPERTYYRPRYSPDGTQFAASVLDAARWKVLVASADGKRVRFVDPEDGANRYDAQWLGNDTLVVVSERGGIANLEVLSVASAMPSSLTRVTGAAVAPDVNRVDGSIWFLALHSHGFDVRRLPRDAGRADTVVAVTGERFGFAAASLPRPVQPATQPVSPARAYGAGPRHQRWLPGAYASADGAGAFLSVYSGDIVGRLNAVATGAYGANGTWQGGSLRAIWRHPRPSIEVGAHGVIHEPSLGKDAQPAADSVDATLVQGLLAVSRERIGESFRVRGRLGGGAGRLTPSDATSQGRALGFGEFELQLKQSRGARAAVERVRLHASYGQTRATYHRILGTAELATSGLDAFPIHLAVTAGRLVGAPHPFEQFTVGGVAPQVMDSSLLGQRYSMPMFPTGIATGHSLLAWRAALPGIWTLFYVGASTADNLYHHKKWNRAVGAERRFLFPLTPVAFVPRVQLRGGAAYTLDAPFRKKVRAYLEMRVEP